MFTLYSVRYCIPTRRTSIQVTWRQSVGRIPPLASRYLSQKVNGSYCMIIKPAFCRKGCIFISHQSQHIVSPICLSVHLCIRMSVFF